MWVWRLGWGVEEEEEKGEVADGEKTRAVDCWILEVIMRKAGEFCFAGYKDWYQCPSSLCAMTFHTVFFLSLLKALRLPRRRGRIYVRSAGNGTARPV